MANASEMELELEEELGGLGEFEQHEGEWEQGEWEQQELTHEFEGDQFFGIKRFVKKRIPLLKNIARLAAPWVATAISGPFGGVLRGVASQALREEEFEHPEMAQEFEHPEYEHPESSQEAAYEIAQHEVTHHEALAEIMAEAAAHEQNEAQAEAMIGAAVATVLSPRDRRTLRRLLPNLVRGAAVLTRILRRRRATRPAVRAVPTIMRRTVMNLKRQAAAGKPVTRRAAGRAAATEVRRVLGSPSACAAAIRQNVRAVRRARTGGKMGC